MKKFIKILVFLIILAILTSIGINLYVVLSTRSDIKTVDELDGTGEYKCILILGCLVDENGPCDMLTDRLDTGIELYKKGVAHKIIMSGDHGTTEYDEVNEMKKYAIEKGVPSEDIFMDHAGFCTYDSVYRARTIFGADKMVIVTQNYHLYRALHIAGRLGVKAYGVNAARHEYKGEYLNEAREFAARIKDFVISVYKPLPEYLGDPIPVSGNGDVTNDKTFD